MAEEKIEKHEHEHEHHETKTVTLKKSTLWGIGVFVLLALLVASVFTSGFGLMKPTGNAAANNGNTGTATTATMSPNAFSDSSLFPTLGPNNAKATVIELADFQCSYCGVAAGLSSQSQQYATQMSDFFGVATKVEQLAQQGKIQFIFVPMSFLGPESTYAAEAGFCALDQGKFWQMHDALFTTNDLSENNGKYTKANLTVIAQSISGLDMNKFNTCLNTDADLARVNQVMTDVQNGVTNFPGTPTFFVNGKFVQSSWSAISAIVGQ